MGFGAIPDLQINPPHIKLLMHPGKSQPFPVENLVVRTHHFYKVRSPKYKLVYIYKPHINAIVSSLPKTQQYLPLCLPTSLPEKETTIKSH